MFVECRRGSGEPAEEIASALRLAEAGLDNGSIARATGIPSETIRTWRRGRLPERAKRALAGLPSCPQCGNAVHDVSALPRDPYAYLLGMYLGGGCVARVGRSGYPLRLALDVAYPGIIASAREAIAAVKGGGLSHAALRRSCACVAITSYWKAWPRLVTQHGPGRKHQRPIELAAWQRAIVEEAPEPFLRALIDTDGRRGFNRVRVKGRDHACPRSNLDFRCVYLTLLRGGCGQAGGKL